LNGSIGICSNIPVPSINSNNINVSGRKLNTRRQFFCPQLFWPTAILVDSFFFFARHLRSQNFTAAPTPRLFSTSTIRNNLFTDSILESNIDFKSNFQFNIFRSIDGVQRFSRSQPPALSLCGIPTAGLFFFVIGPQ
jgi:hypothetical protein